MAILEMVWTCFAFVEFMMTLHRLLSALEMGRVSKSRVILYTLLMRRGLLLHGSEHAGSTV